LLSGHGCLPEQENIRDKEELEQFERMAAAWRLLTLPHNLPITPKGYREIHRYMLQDVYDWAGQDRWIDTGRTGPFCKAEYIIPELKKRFAAINAENDLRGLDADAFAPTPPSMSANSTPSTLSSTSTAAPCALSSKSSPSAPDTQSTWRASIRRHGTRPRSPGFTSRITVPCAVIAGALVETAAS